MNKPTFFITAYGIAKNHGFEGSEEEWLNSLTAFYLAQQAGYSGTIDEWLELLNDPVPEFLIGTVETLPGGSDATVSLGGTRRRPVLNFGIPRGLGMADALPLIGGAMLGSIDMQGFALFGVPVPASDDGAVPRKYVDDSVRVATGAAAGAQATADGAFAAANSASTIANGAAGAAAAAQQEAEKRTLKIPLPQVTLLAGAWTGSSAPYTQTVSVPGITSNDRPYYGPVYSADTQTRIREKEAYLCIDDLDTVDGFLVCSCFEMKPRTDIVIQLEVFR